MDAKKQQATENYLAALNHLEELRKKGESTEEAKKEEALAWDEVKKLMPDAMCR